jgi:hypothetical protein
VQLPDDRRLFSKVRALPEKESTYQSLYSLMLLKDDLATPGLLGFQMSL